MFVCTNCGHLFDEPVCWEERHGFTYGPYETWSGCPKCHEPYVEAKICDCCGEYIDDEYIKMEDGKRYCNHCFTPMNLGDED